MADYCGVDPAYGSLETLHTLVAEAGRRGMEILDPVPQPHREPPVARRRPSSPQSEHRHWYVWSDPGPDGGRPNNWMAQFGGPAWTLDQASGEYYLHNFTREQRTSTGGTRRYTGPSRTSSASGGTAARPDSASTSATC